MPRNAATSPDDGLRYYTWKGERLLSVTSIRKVIGMPFPLHNWVVKRTIGAAIEVMRDPDMKSRIAVTSTPSGDEELTRLIRKTAMEERDVAATKGTDIHSLIEQGVPAKDAPPEMAPYITNAYDAMAACRIVPLVKEAQVWNLTLKYAGSLDLLASVNTGTPDEHLAIIDLKTGKGVYIDHLLQTLAYGMAEFVGKDDIVDPAATDLLTQVQALYILHVSDSAWELLEVKPDRAAWRAFTHMVNLANWLRVNDTIDQYIGTRHTAGLVSAL